YEVFKTTPEFAAQSAVLAANQGLYNGFLAAGLLWGLLSGRRDVKIFFLCCVIVAGVYGGLSAHATHPSLPAPPAPAPPPAAPALAALLAVLAAPAPRLRHRL